MAKHRAQYVGKKADPFYNSTAWRKLRVTVLVRDAYLCQPCLRNKRLTTANTVHHIKPRLDYPELALDMDNCESICPACHNKEHPEKGGGQRVKKSERKAIIVKAKANEEVY